MKQHLPLSGRLTVLIASTFLLAPDWCLGRQVTVIAAGDIEWSRNTKVPGIVVYPPSGGFGGQQARLPEGSWRRVPYVVTDDSRSYLEQLLGRPLEGPNSHHIRAIHYGLEFDSPIEMARYPFRLIAPVLREADIAFANLETPLSDRARNSGAFRTPTAFAEGISWAGIDVVSTANNHALDAEGEGLMDTKEALWRAGVGSVGTGENLEAARRPYIIERDGIKVAFLGYAMFVNAGDDAFALENHAGVVALDPFIIKEDIQRVRDAVDYVMVSFHWAIENSQDTHPAARAFAHDIIDAGADVIIGHHPHVPRGVEVYKGKMIFYSLGNFIFGHGHTYWMDNYLARMTLTRTGITQVEILPIAGSGNNLSQPYLLEGDDARALLEDIQARTAELDTRMEIDGDKGVVIPQSASMRREEPPAPLQEPQVNAAVTGRVIRASTGEPIEDARIAAVGTEFETTSAQLGWYLLKLTPGKHQIRVSAPGLRSFMSEVTLRPQGTGVLDIDLFEDPVSLDAVLVPSSARRRERGDAVAWVDGNVFEVTAANDINAVLRNRLAGVLGLGGGGQVGTSSSIRFRGPNSVTQSTLPLVYIDGIRVSARNIPATPGTGGSANVLDLISPETIAWVQVLRGAAATARYGMEASSGVILIYTKR